MVTYNQFRTFCKIFIFAIVSGCDNTADSIDNDSPLSVDTLIFADTVGIFTGDSNYVFGTLSTVTVVPEGIAVLDGVLCRIALFNSQGEFISSQGRSGSGPGEYSNPWSMCRLKGGEYLISDHGARQMTLLDSSMNYLNRINLNMQIPLKLAAGTDSMVVIKEITIGFKDEQLMGGYRIYSLNAYTGEEGFLYRDYQLPMGASEVDLKSEFCFFTTDTEGNLYLADYDSDQYEIEKYSPEGELLRTYNMESLPRCGFDIEVHGLNRLPMSIPLTTESGTSILMISEPEKYPFVTALAIDGDRNLWVRRMGVAYRENWDVISPDGELLRQVVLVADTSGTGSYPALHVSTSGLVATFGRENEFERFFTVKPADHSTI